jgi:hypothetical protein
VTGGASTAGRGGRAAGEGSGDGATVQRGGVLVRVVGGAADADLLYFIPADVVVEVMPLGTITRPPGLRAPAVGIALARGQVITVLDLADAHALRERDSARPHDRPEEDWPMPGANRALLCTIGGELVAVTGGAVIATGTFDALPVGDGVMWRGKAAPRLDVRTLYVRAEAAIWAARAGARAPAESP